MWRSHTCCWCLNLGSPQCFKKNARHLHIVRTDGYCTNTHCPRAEPFAHCAPFLAAGGSRGFTPLAGIVRGARPPLNAPPAVALAHQLDRLAVTLNQRPVARALLALYMLLLHLAFAVF